MWCSCWNLAKNTSQLKWTCLKWRDPTWSPWMALEVSKRQELKICLTKWFSSHATFVLQTVVSASTTRICLKIKKKRTSLNFKLISSIKMRDKLCCKSKTKQICIPTWQTQSLRTCTVIWTSKRVCCCSYSAASVSAQKTVLSFVVISTFALLETQPPLSHSFWSTFANFYRELFTLQARVPVQLVLQHLCARI